MAVKTHDWNFEKFNEIEKIQNVWNITDNPADIKMMF